MDKKALIQYMILLIVVLLISYIYLNYFRISVEEVKNINNNKKTEKNLPKTTKDLISDLVYSSVDRKGNKYKIKSKEGEIDSEDKNVLIMKKSLFSGANLAIVPNTIFFLNIFFFSIFLLNSNILLVSFIDPLSILNHFS